MKKLYLLSITFLVCTIFLSCGEKDNSRDNSSTISNQISKNDDSIEKEIESDNDENSIKGEVESNEVKNELTIRNVFEFNDKGRNLKFDDFSNFTNAEFINELNTENSILKFKIIYRDHNYILEVKYNKDSLDLIYVKLIYELDNNSIDIRTDSVKDFISKYLSINQYISYNLPQTLENNKFSFDLGSLGGNLFYNKKFKNLEYIAGTESTPYGWNSYGGAEIYYKLDCSFDDKGQLTYVSLPWNHSSYISDFEPIEGCAIPAALVHVDHDLYAITDDVPDSSLSSEFWYIFFCKQDSDISYAIFLNSKYFSKDDIISIAKSVQFTKEAFSIKVE